MVDSERFSNYATVYDQSSDSLNRRHYNSRPAYSNSREDFAPHRLSDTQFDSSTDETVIPYPSSDRASQGYISTASFEPFDPESSPRSHLNRRSDDTDQCGTLYEETVQSDVEISENPSLAMRSSQSHNFEPVEPAEESARESQRLVTSTASKKSGMDMSPDYRAGSCYHCLMSVPVPSLLAWILAFITLIGWAVTMYLGITNTREFLNYLKPEGTLLLYEEIGVIAIAFSTLLLVTMFLIIAVYTSSKMSRYAFTTPRRTNCGYCLTITVILLSSFAIVFWAGIIALTMMPVSMFAGIHIQTTYNLTNCLHLPSFGKPSHRIYVEMPMVEMTTVANMTGIPSSNLSRVSYNTADVSMMCGDQLDEWWSSEFTKMIPLFASLGFALLILISMVCFLIAASSNSRHIKEQMKYVSEPYSYSSENINGSAKPAPRDSPPNNNDTQI